MPCASKTTRISLATDQTLPSGLWPSCRERCWHSFLRKAESVWPKSSAFSCYTQEWKTYVQDEWTLWKQVTVLKWLILWPLSNTNQTNYVRNSPLFFFFNYFFYFFFLTGCSFQSMQVGCRTDTSVCITKLSHAEVTSVRNGQLAWFKNFSLVWKPYQTVTCASPVRLSSLKQSYKVWNQGLLKSEPKFHEFHSNSGYAESQLVYFLSDVL